MQKELAKTSEIKNVGKCLDLYVHSDILLLDYMFNSFRNMILKKSGLKVS